MTSYDINSLRRAFPVLDISDRTLVPALHAAFQKWIAQVPEQKGVTDFRKEERRYSRNPSDLYFFTLDSQLVAVHTSYSDINMAEGAAWHMVSRIGFRGNDKKAIEKAARSFRAFIAFQGLGNLVEESAEILREGLHSSGDYVFSREMHDFYHL